MSFKEIPEARQCIRLYALGKMIKLTVVKSDRSKLRFTCSEGACPFVCHISGDSHTLGVRIKTLNDNHTCWPIFDNPVVDYSIIAQYFKKKLQENQKFKIKEMRAGLNNAFKLKASQGNCKIAKRMVLETLECGFNDGYNKLEAYAIELKESNPGSDVVINLSKEALAQGKRKFLRMYICFKAMKMGFKEGMRPFIGLDGTFLRAIVDKETKRTWNWCLELLQHSLELHNGEGITFTSDMQKGLLDAIKMVFPQAHSRYCLRHIEANWCKRHGKGVLKNLLWWSAWCTYEEDFQDHLSQLKQMDLPAGENLLEYPPKSWCRAYFDIVCKNPRVENNIIESFNSWILEASFKPIIGMLENIKIKVMNRLGEQEDSVMKWTSEFSPKSLKLYNEYLKIAQICRVDCNGDNGYEVTEGDDRHIVNLRVKRCTCRAWDLEGIPCPHTIKALLHERINPLTEINWYHSKEAFLLTYKHKLQPMRGEFFWKIDPLQVMEPPEFVKLAGRPRTKRVRQKDEALKRQGEWAVSRKVRVMTCSNCGEPNHNVRGSAKSKNEKMLATGKGKKKQRKRGLVDEGEPFQTEESINLTAPQETQNNQSNMLSDYEYDEDPCLHPTIISETLTRLQMRQ
ncbi:hypothetical protein KY285_034529 [Solanum tuberosum]|nr:hypothetical protein KY285_034529 [Solanum tuberosum]